MNTINEMCLAWYMWVNGNYDILIMTITLIVVAGLVLEVIRLNRKLDNLNSKVDYDFKTVERLFADVWKLEEINKDQVKVNVHLAEDIAELQKKLKRKK